MYLLCACQYSIHSLSACGAPPSWLAPCQPAGTLALPAKAVSKAWNYPMEENHASKLACKSSSRSTCKPGSPEGCQPTRQSHPLLYGPLPPLGEMDGRA